MIVIARRIFSIYLLIIGFIYSNLISSTSSPSSPYDFGDIRRTLDYFQPQTQHRSSSSSSSGERVACDERVPSFETTIIRDEYLVFFSDSRMQSAHHSRLSIIVGVQESSDSWQLVRRVNPLTQAFPTDFLVLKIRKPEILATLRRHESVRRILAHKSIREVLKCAADAEAGAVESGTNDDNDGGENDSLFKTIDSSNDNKHRPIGRLHTKFSMDFLRDDEDHESNLVGDEDDEASDKPAHNDQQPNCSFSTMRDTFATGDEREPTIVVDHLNIKEIWNKQITGAGVKVAIFDTGLRTNHPHFKRIKEITNWTDERSSDDTLGHGTFVASVVGGRDERCPGIAPDADLHIFRVFTSGRVSYTAWFLDAMNYAIHTDIDVLNLSIGGPDFLDRPFVEKVWELSANGIIVVSAIGNDGPLYGTLNNPADQLDVIGVGGIDERQRVARFSSRGMTTWELPAGYGRVKPDIVAPSSNVRGAKIYGSCRLLSGTSVASPVVAGVVTLLISAVPRPRRASIINAASVKQALIEGAERVRDANIFEQGAGRISVSRSLNIIQNYTPRVSFFPAAYDFTDCPYMWPYCAQAIYIGGMPIMLNATILNGLGVTGEVVEPPRWRAGINGHRIRFVYSYSPLLWPWSGYLAAKIDVDPIRAQPGYEGERGGDKEANGTVRRGDAFGWTGAGIAEGQIEITVRSPPGPGEKVPRQQVVKLPVRVRIMSAPPRHRRLLWDQFHSVRYPTGYVPRDVLALKQEPFDWNADHPHTNFRGLFQHLRTFGYYIDIAGEPLTCIDLSKYGALLMVDSEDEFYPAEVAYVQAAVDDGLALITIADWYNTDVMMALKFFDENTKQWWTPATGGANVPALNTLLAPFHIAFGDDVYRGDFAIDGNIARFASGVALTHFPPGGALIHALLINETSEMLSQKPSNGKGKQDNDDDDKQRRKDSSNEREDEGALTSSASHKHKVPILGVLPVSSNNGFVVAFGDSSCLDDAHRRNRCFWLLDAILGVVCDGISLRQMFTSVVELEKSLVDTRRPMPSRLSNSTLPSLSKVLGHALVCGESMTVNGANSLSVGPHGNHLIEWPIIVWASEIDDDDTEPNDLSSNDSTKRKPIDDNDALNDLKNNNLAVAYWRSVTQDVDARTVILPYVLGLVAALFVSCVAVKVPNQRRKEKDDDFDYHHL